MNLSKSICSLLFLLHFNLIFAQGSTFKKILHLSFPEKCWVVFHPFIAKKCFHLTQKALNETEKLKQDTILDGDWNGGQVDAFRHSYWMALLSQKIKTKKAEKLGNAHEKGNYIDFKKHRLEESQMPDSLSTVMDLYNNKIGIATGCGNKGKNEEQLRSIIISLIHEGRMKKLLKDLSGNYLDCSGNKIDMKQWKGKWSIPKCLVNSNQ